MKGLYTLFVIGNVVLALGVFSGWPLLVMSSVPSSQWLVWGLVGVALIIGSAVAAALNLMDLIRYE